MSNEEASKQLKKIVTDTPRVWKILGLAVISFAFGAYFVSHLIILGKGNLFPPDTLGIIAKSVFENPPMKVAANVAILPKMIDFTLGRVTVIGKYAGPVATLATISIELGQSLGRTEGNLSKVFEKLDWDDIAYILLGFIIRLVAENWAKKEVESKFNLILTESLSEIDQSNQNKLILYLIIELKSFKSDLALKKFGNNDKIRRADDILKMLSKYRQKLDQE